MKVYQIHKIHDIQQTHDCARKVCHDVKVFRFWNSDSQFRNQKFEFKTLKSRVLTFARMKPQVGSANLVGEWSNRAPRVTLSKACI